MNLLSIDVEAELERLGSDRLHGPWALPTELVRLAINRQGRKIDVTVERGRFKVVASGARLSTQEISHLAVLFDSARSAFERHQAVVALEKAGADALVAFHEVENLTLRSVDEGLVTTLEAGSGRCSQGSHETQAENGFVITVRLAVPNQKAVVWLESRCCFAPVEVVLNGRRVDLGFDGALIRQQVARPLPSSLALMADDGQPLIYLLMNGVVSTRATVPGYPAFRAAVELAGEVQEELPPKELRAALTPFLSTIIDRVADMALQVAEDLPSLKEPLRRRLVSWLLEAAASGVQRRRILDQPLLEQVGSAGPDWVSVRSVMEASERGPVAMVSSVESWRRLDRRTDRVLILGDEERDQLAECGVSNLWRPRPRSLGDDFREHQRRFVRALKASAASLRDRGARQLDQAELSPGQQRLLAAFNKEAGVDLGGHSVQWRMTDAASPPLRCAVAGGEMLIAGAHPLVVSCVEVLESSGGQWLYPVAVALGAALMVDLDRLRREWVTIHTKTPAGGRTAPLRSTMDDPDRIRSLFARGQFGEGQ